MISIAWDTFEEALTPSSGPGKGRRDLQRWDGLGLEDVEDNFLERFGAFATSSARLGTISPEYRNALTLYCQDCVVSAKHVAKRREVAGMPFDASFEADIKDALAWPDTRRHAPPLPFPTRSCVARIFEVFGAMPNAIREVRV